MFYDVETSFVLARPEGAYNPRLVPASLAYFPSLPLSFYAIRFVALDHDAWHLVETLVGWRLL